MLQWLILVKSFQVRKKIKLDNFTQKILFANSKAMTKEKADKRNALIMKTTLLRLITTNNKKKIEFFFLQTLRMSFFILQAFKSPKNEVKKKLKTNLLRN